MTEDVSSDRVYYPELDGLRFIAFLLVFGFHGGFPWVGETGIILMRHSGHVWLDSVWMTRTACPALIASRAVSSILYAAIPPVTPSRSRDNFVYRLLVRCPKSPRHRAATGSGT